MPTTEVKPFSADGTAWVTAWESRSSLDFFLHEFLAYLPVKICFFYIISFKVCISIRRSSIVSVIWVCISDSKGEYFNARICEFSS